MGIDGYLRLYSLGKKQILLKAEFKKRFRLINGIKVTNDKIFISDVADSIHLVGFSEKSSQFFEIAEDLLPRFVTCFDLLDSSTAVLADKFGNISAQRLPLGAENDLIGEEERRESIWAHLK